MLVQISSPVAKKQNVWIRLSLRTYLMLMLVRLNIVDPAEQYSVAEHNKRDQGAGRDQRLAPR